MRLNLLFFLFIFYTISLQAQVTKDSLTFSHSRFNNKKLITNFDKQLNTFNLNSGINYNLRSEKLFLGVEENFKSTVIRGNPKNIRDEQSFTLVGEYNFINQFAGGVFLNSTIYSDNRSLAINQTSNLNSLGFLRWKPKKNIDIIPYAGFSSNNQIGIKNDGLLFGLESGIKNLYLSDFRINSSLKYSDENINPRKNMNRYINLSVVNNFDYYSSNTLEFRFTRNKKDFFFDADSVTSAYYEIEKNIQTRDEYNYSLEDRLSYNNVLSYFSFDVFGKASWREIDREIRYKLFEKPSSSIFDTKVEEFRLDLQSVLSYNSDFADLFLRINIEEREEKHITERLPDVSELFYNERDRLESAKNNSSSRTAISLSSEIHISEDDVLNFSGFHSKLAYDTPSEDNFDDRDELLTIFRVYYSRRLNSFFNLFLNFEGSINKIVYLFAERSSNNNIKRIIKLGGGGIYTGKYVSSSNSFDVTSNYTVYDYRDLIPSLTSFSYRQLSARDSTEIKFSDKLSLLLLGSLKFSEQGNLNWGDFTSKPTRFIEEILTEPKIYTVFNSIRMGFGIRYFLLKTYRYENKEKIEDTSYRSIGPVSEIKIMINRKLFLDFDGWYEFLNITGANISEQVRLNFEVQWNL